MSSTGSTDDREARGPRVSLLLLCIGVASVAAMWGSIAGPFIFDDVPLIVGNHYVQSFEHWTRWFSGRLWDSNFDPVLEQQTRGFWRPLVLMTYAWDWTLGGGSPLVFHLTNLCVHALNACLLFSLLKGWTKNRIAALFGSVLFAVHPVQTEAIAWIAGRTDALCLTGLLLATLGLRSTSRLRRWGLLGLGLAVAFGSKEMAVVFPALAGIELWSHKAAPLDQANIKQLLKRLLPFVALSLSFVVIHRLWVDSGPRAAPQGLLLRALLVFEAWGRYALLLLWPDDLTFGRAYMRFVRGVVQPHFGYAAFGAAFTTVVSAVAFISRNKRPAISLGLLAYLGLLLPVSSVTWLGYEVLVSPRFLYIPLLGLALALAAGVSALLDAPNEGPAESSGQTSAPAPQRYATWIYASLTAVLVAAGTRSFTRSADFDSEDQFWRQEITHNESYQPAQQYFITRELNAGRPRAALHMAHVWFQRLSAETSNEAKKAQLIVKTLSALMALTPDIDTGTLKQLQSFAGSLSESRPSTLSLPQLGLQLNIGENEALLNRLGNDSRQLGLIAAEAAVRTGDDVQAKHWADRALAGCSDCWTVLINAGLILARASELDRALDLARTAARVGAPEKANGLLTLVEQAQALRPRLLARPSVLLEVQYYAALGSFGRAYKAAQPVLQAPPSDSASLERLAELAYLAGDEHTCRSLLERAFDREQVEIRLVDMAAKARWKEQALPNSVWSPEPSLPTEAHARR